MLKVNTTLKTLHLQSGKRKGNIKKKQHILTFFTDNGIGEEGAKVIREIVKSNTTLMSLDLCCEKEG